MKSTENMSELRMTFELLCAQSLNDLKGCVMFACMTGCHVGTICAVVSLNSSEDFTSSSQFNIALILLFFIPVRQLSLFVCCQSVTQFTS